MIFLPVNDANIRVGNYTGRYGLADLDQLPINLKIERIKAGNSNSRNPILISYVAKGLLPYHGLGSGITRALDQWPEMDFTDDRDGCLFKAIVNRKEGDGTVPPTVSGETLWKTSGIILEAILQNSTITIPELSILIGITERSIERNVQKLHKEGTLKRIGPAKGGHWQVS